MTAREDETVVLAVATGEQLARIRRELADTHTVHAADLVDDVLDGLSDPVDVVLVESGLTELAPAEFLADVREMDASCRVALLTADEPPGDPIGQGFDAVVEADADALTETVDRLVTRTAYESTLDEFYGLCVRRAKARADGGTDAVFSDDAGADVDAGYAELEERIRDLRDTLDQLVESFETADYRASFRDLE